jgi:hypothetical protein
MHPNRAPGEGFEPPTRRLTAAGSTTELTGNGLFNCARGQGFEPQSVDPESTVLPLNDPRIFNCVFFGAVPEGRFELPWVSPSAFEAGVSAISPLRPIMEATDRFELSNAGFADQPLKPLGYVAKTKERKPSLPPPQRFCWQALPSRSPIRRAELRLTLTIQKKGSSVNHLPAPSCFLI